LLPLLAFCAICSLKGGVGPFLTQFVVHRPKPHVQNLFHSPCSNVVAHPTTRAARQANRGMSTVQGFRSAFFIDTDARLLSLPAGSASVRWWAKAALLIGTLALVWRMLSVPRPCPRRFPVFLCACVFVARVLLQMAYFWSRSINWKEVILEAGGIIPLSLASLAAGASWTSSPLGALDVVAFIVFLFGTWLNIWPEYQRFLWNKCKENKGKLYAGSLFAWCRHINYTGEILSFVGFSLITGALWTLWVPVVMGAGMATFSIREIEFYLSQKYKDEWPRYIQQVPYLMVPWVY